MDINTPNFDRLARIYRWMEYFSFGPMLERCRFHFLSRCLESRQALILGDGDGRFTARLMAANPLVQVDAVDASSAMSSQLRHRVLRHSPQADARLQTIQADLRSFCPSPKDYDLVVSHFFLDCLTNEEVAVLAERVASHSAHNATWLVSEFSIPEKGWRRAGSRVLVRSLYLVFSWMTGLRVHRLPDYAAVLGSHGFYRGEQHKLLQGLLVSEIWTREA